MGENSQIEWTDNTFNPWIGCQKVSPGCDNCYAEALVTRYKWTEWGPHGDRKRTSPANWKKPLQWNRKASVGNRAKVFCASLADVFDNQVPREWRIDLFDLIQETPLLDWQLLTKRPENFEKFLPPDFSRDTYPNVWLGITTENQDAYNRRWPLLYEMDAAVRFISYEPAIGVLTVCDANMKGRPDWVICGGESGPKARAMNSSWARIIRNDCFVNDISFFFKQWGHYENNPLRAEQGRDIEVCETLDGKHNGKGGAMLDGKLYRQFPV